MEIETYIFIINLNVIGVNAPTKRYRLVEWKQKHNIYIHCLKRLTSYLGTHTDWKWRDGKRIFHANENQKKVGVALHISDKIAFKIKRQRDEEGHCIMIKGSNWEEDITIVNIYAPNIEAPQYIRQMLRAIKG